MIYIYIPYPIGSMYAIYGNIYHQYIPVMLAYIPYMDPMDNYWIIIGNDQLLVVIHNYDYWIIHINCDHYG